MSAGLVGVVLLGVSLFLAGAAALIIVIASARLAGPDTDQRDPYGLAGRADDSGVHWCCCYCAAPSGMDHPDWCPRAGVDVALDGLDGSHENRSDVDDQRWAAEVLQLHEMWPEAALLGMEPDAQGDVLPPPIIPGRGGEGGN